MRFPRPRLVTFDAFGTIYTPKGSVALQYSEFLKNHHDMEVPAQTIASQFPHAYRQVESEHPSYGKNSPTGITIQHWWEKVIRQTFEPTKLPESAVTGLYHHFNTKQAYQIFGDAVACMRHFQTNRVNIGVLSNSDPRLLEVLQSMDLMGVIGGSDRVCISYDLGYEKPSTEAFNLAQRRLSDDPVDPSSTQNNLWHVGDDPVKDGDGAVGAGWNCIIVDRTRSASGPVINKQANGTYRVLVSSLDAVPGMFEL